MNWKKFFLGNLIGLLLMGFLIGFINPTYADSTNWGQQPPSFPSCTNMPSSAVQTWNSTGMNQIAGQSGQVYGTDTVYSIGNNNSVQCYCPNNNPGTQGIQTNWWGTNLSNYSGWMFINNSNNQWGLGGASYLAQNSSFACNVPPPSTPTATPSATTTTSSSSSSGSGGSSGGGSSTNAPVCSDGSTIQLPANVFVVRSKDYTSATVNFFITEGNQANIYYKELGQSNWDHSVIGVTPNSDKFVSYTINDLSPAVGYDFAVQQVQGCGGGQLASAVVVDGPQARTFTFSYWEWSK